MPCSTRTRPGSWRLSDVSPQCSSLKHMTAVNDTEELSEDAAFVGLFADYYASHHIFIGEGEGAVVLERFIAEHHHLQGRKSLFYADTSPATRFHVARMRSLNIEETIIADTLLGVLTRAHERVRDLDSPARIYGCGSQRLLALIREISYSIDHVPCSIMLQRRDPDWKTVCCSRCGNVEEHRVTQDTICTRCQAKLIVSDFYSASKAAFMGIKATDRKKWGAGPSSAKRS